MKKLDKLLITSFIPPFIVTFFIALFVFVMQTLWLYIDDIAGKGVGFFLLTELVAYLSVSMIRHPPAEACTELRGKSFQPRFPGVFHPNWRQNARQQHHQERAAVRQRRSQPVPAFDGSGGQRQDVRLR
ncbi:MAG: LptF/LptG family permease [Saprospiraceae bacterium]|nr:LptF/LptG family permease [Saprospiraceae bacterium]